MRTQCLQVLVQVQSQRGQKTDVPAFNCATIAWVAGRGLTVRFRSLRRSFETSEAGKQSEKTLLDTFERYLEGYITLFDATWSV